MPEPDPSSPTSPPPPLRLSRFIIVAFGCLYLCIGQYGFMQAIAWGGMLIDYSSKKGLVDGVKDTFDGGHPCKLCCAIQKTKQQEPEQKKAPWQSGLKEFGHQKLIAADQLRLRLPSSFDYHPPAFAIANTLLENFTPTPETPPPEDA